MANTRAEMIQGVKAYALEHYEDGGWDVIVECWEDAEIEKYIDKDACTIAAAIDSFRDLVSVWADRQADARNSAF